MIDYTKFNLRKKEDLVASMIGYLSGHTGLLTDFSEGSIIRSIFESVGNEIYRQNIVFAQSLTDSIRSSVKQAFSAPLLEATKATGLYTFYREMLQPPANLTLVQSSDATSALTQSTSSATVATSGTVYSGTPTSITVGAISGSGPYTTTVTLAGATWSPYVIVGATLSGATTLSLGSLGSGIVRVTEVTSATVIKISSTATMTAGTLNVSTAFVSTTKIIPYNSVAFTGYVGVSSNSGSSITSASNTLTVSNNVALSVGQYLSGIGSAETLTITGIISSSSPTNRFVVTHTSRSEAIAAGSYIIISGVGTPAYNQTWLVESSTTSTVTVLTSTLLTSPPTVTGATITNPTKIIGVLTGSTYSLNNSMSVTSTSLTAANQWQYTLNFPVSSGYFTSASSLISSADIGTGSLAISGFSNDGTTYSMTVITTGGNRPAGYPSTVSWTNPWAAFSAPSLTSPVSMTLVSALPDGGTYSAGTYYYSVTAINNGRETSATPAISAVIAANGRASLTWNAIPSATSYRIYVSQNQYMINAKYRTSTTNAFVDSVFGGTSANWPNTTITWAVSAKNTTNAVPAETLPSTASITPTGNTVSMTWSSVEAIDGNATTGYNVYRSSQDPSLDYPQNLSATLSSEVSQSLTASTAYYWSVSTLTKSAESLGSPSVSLTTSSSQKSALLTWSAVAGAIAYRVYRSTNSSMSSAVSIDVLSTSLTDIGTNIATSCVFSNAELLATVVETTSVNNISVWKYVDAGSSGTSSSWLYIPTAHSVSGPIVIGSGTQVGVVNTSKQYIVPYVSTMAASDRLITVDIECVFAGKLGNTPGKTITNIITNISGIDSGLNDEALINGYDLETEEEWRIRFGKIIKNLSRGTLYSLESGASSVSIKNTNGFVVDSVTSVLAYESSNNAVSLYIHNGTNDGASADLVLKTQKIINGYTDEYQITYPGYKPAGIPVTVFAASRQYQDISVHVVTDSGITLKMVQVNIYNTVTSYFQTLSISDGFPIPVITSIATNAGSGSTTYQYKIIAIDVNGNKSYPSKSVAITTGPSSLNSSTYNTLTWSVSGTNIASYDIVRWNGTAWGYVANYVGSSGTLTYQDVLPDALDYTFSPSRVVIFDKSTLLQKIMKITGINSASISVFDSGNNDQDNIVPGLGIILVPGIITIR